MRVLVIEDDVVTAAKIQIVMGLQKFICDVTHSRRPCGCQRRMLREPGFDNRKLADGTTRQFASRSPARCVHSALTRG